MEPSTTRSEQPWLWLNARDQRSIATLMTALLVVNLGWVLVDDPMVNIDQSRAPEELRFETNLNSADWPELLLLPEIGETLARRIVVWRQRNGRFESVEQLQHVKGIGPAKLKRIRPFLRPITSSNKRESLP